MADIRARAGGVWRDLVSSLKDALHVKTFPSAPRFIRDVQLTVSSASIGLPVSIPEDAYSAYIQITAAPVYYTLDAATPSATNGQDLDVGDDLYVYGRPHLVALRFIRQGATDATAKISYFKEDEQ